MGTETELRLVVLGSAERLMRVPVLARSGPPAVRTLFNRYYDTPDGDLARAGVSLRVRRGEGGWVQTLKLPVAGAAPGLSVRSEWEWPLGAGRLSRTRLRGLDAWQALDPDGAWRAALQPCFMTHYERRSWTLRRRGGVVVEVALDQGEILAGVRHAPICELELELKAGGDPRVLRSVARSIAREVAMLPGGQSKPQRGAGLLGWCEGAQAVESGALTTGILVVKFSEFVNKVTEISDICREDSVKCITVAERVESVHQTRVAWRRFASVLRFLRPRLGQAARRVAARSALQPLLGALGRWRDLDVAVVDTLPLLEATYVGRDAARRAQWDLLLMRLEAARTQARAEVRSALERPQTGGALLDFWRTLEELPERPERPGEPLMAWAQRRLRRMDRRLRTDCPAPEDLEGQHRVRIAAKRLRYVLECLPQLEVGPRGTHRLRELRDLQAGLGARRDLMQAATLAGQWPDLAELAAFLGARARLSRTSARTSRSPAPIARGSA